MTILDELAAYAAERVEADKRTVSCEEIRRLAENGEPAGGKRFYDAVAKPGISFICEVKKASPSKGVIDPVFDYMGIAKTYESVGADAISCLTEPKWFLGSDTIFCEIRKEVATPMLRKDFVVNDYQIYQAKVMGADCVLLICAILENERIKDYLTLCESLGLAALVETHDASEIEKALDAGAMMVGVNNRNLKDFSVNLSNAKGLRSLIPADKLFVAESGVATPEDAADLYAAGADAILVGEAMMRAADKGEFLAAARRAAEHLKTETVVRKTVEA